MKEENNNNYFNFISLLKKDYDFDLEQKKNEFIILRRKRYLISGFAISSKLGFFFSAGDILRIAFYRGAVGYYFEGLCLAIKKKELKHKNTSILLRNVILGVGIEVIVSYYYHRLYNLSFSDYKRKRFFYYKRHLYYLRQRSNNATEI